MTSRFGWGLVAPAGGGRRVCHGAPATSAPVDHASRTGWGRTVRLPPQRSGQRDRADEPTGAGLGRLEGGPRNGPSLLLGRDRRAFRRVGAERRVRGARVAVDDLEVESLRQCVALVARRGHHLRGRDEDHSRGPSTISTLGHESHRRSRRARRPPPRRCAPASRRGPRSPTPRRGATCEGLRMDPEATAACRRSRFPPAGGGP